MSAKKITAATSKDFLEAHKDAFVVLIFDAEFSGQQDLVDKAVKALTESDLREKLVIAIADVEENNDLATDFSILSVPMIACIMKGQLVKKIDSLDGSKLVNTIREESIRQALLSGGTNDTEGDTKKKFEDYLKKLTNRAPVMIFMKGEPQAPRCKFSRELVEILGKHSVKYETFDILQDEEVRQGLKEYSDWPTYPQIYARGEFVGGLDVLKQLVEAGELESTLKGGI